MNDSNALNDHSSTHLDRNLASSSLNANDHIKSSNNYPQLVSPAFQPQFQTNIPSTMGSTHLHADSSLPITTPHSFFLPNSPLTANGSSSIPPNPHLAMASPMSLQLPSSTTPSSTQHPPSTSTSASLPSTHPPSSTTPTPFLPNQSTATLQQTDPSRSFNNSHQPTASSALNTTDAPAVRPSSTDLDQLMQTTVENSATTTTETLAPKLPKAAARPIMSLSTQSATPSRRRKHNMGGLSSPSTHIRNTPQHHHPFQSNHLHASTITTPSTFAQTTPFSTTISSTTSITQFNTNNSSFSFPFQPPASSTSARFHNPTDPAFNNNAANQVTQRINNEISTLPQLPNSSSIPFSTISTTFTQPTTHPTALNFIPEELSNPGCINSLNHDTTQTNTTNVSCTSPNSTRIASMRANNTSAMANFTTTTQTTAHLQPFTTANALSSSMLHIPFPSTPTVASPTTARFNASTMQFNPTQINPNNFSTNFVSSFQPSMFHSSHLDPTQSPTRYEAAIAHAEGTVQPFSLNQSHHQHHQHHQSHSHSHFPSTSPNHSLGHYQSTSHTHSHSFQQTPTHRDLGLTQQQLPTIHHHHHHHHHHSTQTSHHQDHQGVDHHINAHSHTNSTQSTQSQGLFTQSHHTTTTTPMNHTNTPVNQTAMSPFPSLFSHTNTAHTDDLCNNADNTPHTNTHHAHNAPQELQNHDNCNCHHSHCTHTHSNPHPAAFAPSTHTQPRFHPNNRSGQPLRHKYKTLTDPNTYVRPATRSRSGAGTTSTTTSTAATTTAASSRNNGYAVKGRTSISSPSTALPDHYYYTQHVSAPYVSSIHDDIPQYKYSTSTATPSTRTRRSASNNPLSTTDQYSAGYTPTSQHSGTHYQTRNSRRNGPQTDHSHSNTDGIDADHHGTHDSHHHHNCNHDQCGSDCYYTQNPTTTAVNSAATSTSTPTANSAHSGSNDVTHNDSQQQQSQQSGHAPQPRQGRHLPPYLPHSSYLYPLSTSSRMKNQGSASTGDYYQQFLEPQSTMNQDDVVDDENGNTTMGDDDDDDDDGGDDSDDSAFHPAYNISTSTSTIKTRSSASQKNSSSSSSSSSAAAQNSLFCSVCNKQFDKKAQYQKHIKQHSSAQRLHGCIYCPKRFTTQANARIHMNTHINYKPFECGQCGKRFTQISTLRNHELIHSGERPHKCACGRSFTQLATLIAHVRRGITTSCQRLHD